MKSRVSDVRMYRRVGRVGVGVGVVEFQLNAINRWSGLSAQWLFAATANWVVHCEVANGYKKPIYLTHLLTSLLTYKRSITVAIDRCLKVCPSVSHQPVLSPKISIIFFGTLSNNYGFVKFCHGTSIVRRKCGQQSTDNCRMFITLNAQLSLQNYGLNGQSRTGLSVYLMTKDIT